jgi:membrane protease YdiL (CAAX protease family)
MPEALFLKQHTPLQSIALHLLPGVLITAGYFALLGSVARVGYPSIMALVLSGMFLLVPVQLGYLLVQGKRLNGRYGLRGVISYRRPLPAKQYLLWVPLLFVLTGLIFTVTKPVSAILQAQVFNAWPPLQTGMEGGFEKGALVLTYVLFSIFIVVLGPAVEELYFRGYLLPRMGYAGKWDVVLHSFLFAVYHFFTPWMVFTRTLGMIPLAFAVKRKNIWISVIVHVLANSLDLFAAIAFIASIA